VHAFRASIKLQGFPLFFERFPAPQPGSVDADLSVANGLQDVWLSRAQELFNLAHVPDGYSRHLSNLGPNIDRLSFRQICQTFLSAADLLVRSRLFLKWTFKIQSKDHSTKVIKAIGSAMFVKQELEGLLVGELVLNTWK